MITYELAKKLKEAGFPQAGEKYIDREGSVYTPDESQTTSGELTAYCPTLSELIATFGDEFLSLEKGVDNWLASADEDGNMPVVIEGKTPEEAVANLWLALK